MSEGGERKRVAQGDAGGKRKKNKSYYKNFAKNGKRGAFTVGSRGVLVTCDHITSHKALAEAIDILTEYADKLYPVPDDVVAEEEEEESVADALKKEIENLKKEKNDKAEKTPRISPLDMDRTRGVLFIQCAEPIDPEVLVLSIMKDCSETKQLRTRFIQRMIPVSTTCKANEGDIVKAARGVIAPYFHQPEQSNVKYAVWYRARNNEALDRLTIINALAVLATEGKEHKVDLTNPDLVIVAEIVS
eukprot:Ihof_evm2s542 gene=Ihof_evmTU2s542